MGEFGNVFSFLVVKFGRFVVVLNAGATGLNSSSKQTRGQLFVYANAL